MRKITQNIVLSLAALVFLLLLFEICIRFLIAPSDDSYGTLFGIELPPLKLPPPATEPKSVDRSTWYQGLIVDGKKITIGDLWGFLRDDPWLGYVPEENTISTNGWWQTNNLGAREREDTALTKTPGQQRWLVFGDSFAVGSRIPQEAVWSAVLDTQMDEAEIVNFGVDGYGMGQAYLRYQTVREKIEHDLVLLMFVPTHDLWREVNTQRDIGGDWDMYNIMPRFVIEQGGLKLITYAPSPSYQADHERGTDQALKDHLRQYDRLYFEYVFEEPRFIGRLILYKLFIRIVYENQRKRFFDSLLTPGSEALEVSTAIFKEMNNDVQRDGKEFVLVVLPSIDDLQKFDRDRAFRDQWGLMVESICTDELHCVDLTEALDALPIEQLDSAFDHSHYGPQTNEMLAGLIRQHLESVGMVSK